jgi:hypothetical protein
MIKFKRISTNYLVLFTILASGRKLKSSIDFAVGCQDSIFACLQIQQKVFSFKFAFKISKKYFSTFVFLLFFTFILYLHFHPGGG